MKVRASRIQKSEVDVNPEDPNLSKGPRGIRGFSLSSGNFGNWKVQGKVGGYNEYV